MRATAMVVTPLLAAAALVPAASAPAVTAQAPAAVSHHTRPDVLATTTRPDVAGAPQGICSDTPWCTGRVAPDPTHKSDGRRVAWMVPPDHNNHASFIHELPDGDLGLVWFSGTEEGQFNCSIFYSRLPSGSSQWTPPMLISRRFDWSNENPNLMTDPKTGWLIAHHSSQPASNCRGDPTNSGHNGSPCCPANTLLSPGPSTSCEHYAEIWRVVSKDGKGETWEEPRPFLSTPASFSRNRPIQLSGGEWLFPMFYAQGTFGPKSDAECLGWPEVEADYAGLWRSPPNDPLSFHCAARASRLPCR